MRVQPSLIQLAFSLQFLFLLNHGRGIGCRYCKPPSESPAWYAYFSIRDALPKQCITHVVSCISSSIHNEALALLLCTVWAAALPQGRLSTASSSIQRNGDAENRKLLQEHSASISVAIHPPGQCSVGVRESVAATVRWKAL